MNGEARSCIERGGVRTTWAQGSISGGRASAGGVCGGGAGVGGAGGNQQDHQRSVGQHEQHQQHQQCQQHEGNKRHEGEW